MTENPRIPEAGDLATEVEADAKPSPIDSVSPSSTAAPAAARQTRYCPTCQARYIKAETECVTCHVSLVEDQPRDVSLFRPELDLPFVLVLALFVFGYDRLNGEAQSFGLIFLLVGFAILVTFRAISYVEWLGRR